MQRKARLGARSAAAILAIGLGLDFGSAYAADSAGGNYPYVGGRPVRALGDHGPGKVDTLIWRDSSFSYVAIVPAEKGAETPFAHPIGLDAAQLRQGLQRLKASFDGGKPRQVFPNAAIDQLAEPMSQGLAQLGPEQELLVQAVSRDPALGIFFGPTVTNARVFAADGYLQFVLGEVRGEFADEFRATGVLRAFAKPARNAERKTLWALVGDELTLAAVGGDPVRVAVSPAAWSHVAVPTVRAASSEPPPGPGLGAPATEATTAAATAAPATPAPAALPAATSGAASAAPTPAVDPSSRFAQRLRTLEQLHDEGLISDQEYQSKRQEILGEL